MTRQSKWKIWFFMLVTFMAILGMEGFNHFLQGKKLFDINGKIVLAQTTSEPTTNTDQELKIALISGKPVLVDFGSNKCIPCRQLRPILKAVEKELAGEAHVLIIDIYNFGKLAREHRVQLIPTLIFFDSSGKEIYRHMGVWDKKSIIDKLKSAGEKS
jgi:thioredoxin 1